MIISHLHKFIFVKTRKTGGTSMEIALSAHCGPMDVITRITAEDEAYRQELGFPGPQNLDVPFARSVPFTRSLAREMLRTRGRRRTLQYRNHFSAATIRRCVGAEVWDNYFTFTIERNPFDKAISRYHWEGRHRKDWPTIDDYVCSAPTRFLSDWDIYAIDDRAAVDFVLRYESLAEHLDVLSARLGIQVRLPERRAKGGFRSDRRDYRDVLSPVSRSKIEGVCWREMSMLGYQW